MLIGRMAPDILSTPPALKVWPNRARLCRAPLARFDHTFRAGGTKNAGGHPTNYLQSYKNITQASTP